MTMKIDKQNGDVCFNEDAHIYFDIKHPEKTFISVTSLIHKFEPEFDSEFWSGYKTVEQLINPDYWSVAKRELLQSKKITESFLKGFDIDLAAFNVAQQNILDNWKKENEASTERGSGIHANLEHSFYKQKTNISLQKYGIGGSFTCEEGRVDLDLENGIYPEYLIHYSTPDGKVNLAGQIDLLVKEGDSFSIVDWKTNKQIKTSSYFNQKTKSSEKLKYPLNTLDSCNYSVYNMQLSTYAWMIQQLHPNWKCNKLTLVHFDHKNNMTTYDMEYLKDQVESMITFWKKQVVMEKHKQDRKQIVY